MLPESLRIQLNATSRAYIQTHPSPLNVEGMESKPKKRLPYSQSQHLNGFISWITTKRASTKTFSTRQTANLYLEFKSPRSLLKLKIWHFSLIIALNFASLLSVFLCQVLRVVSYATIIAVWARDMPKGSRQQLTSRGRYTQNLDSKTGFPTRCFSVSAQYQQITTLYSSKWSSLWIRSIKRSNLHKLASKGKTQSNFWANEKSSLSAECPLESTHWGRTTNQWCQFCSAKSCSGRAWAFPI